MAQRNRKTNSEIFLESKKTKLCMLVQCGTMCENEKKERTERERKKEKIER